MSGGDGGSSWGHRTHRFVSVAVTRIFGVLHTVTMRGQRRRSLVFLFETFFDPSASNFLFSRQSWCLTLVFSPRCPIVV